MCLFDTPTFIVLQAKKTAKLQPKDRFCKKKHPQKEKNSSFIIINDNYFVPLHTNFGKNTFKAYMNVRTVSVICPPFNEITFVERSFNVKSNR